MNALNALLNGVFDAVLTPLELGGVALTVIVVSGVFGVLGLVLFKCISWQQGIKAAKDRIKGHMIEIRLFQDDLRVVGRAILMVLVRNLQYLGLNFGPILPLAIPFAFLAAQFVVRYAYDPLPVVAADAKLLPGQGTLVEVQLAAGRYAEVAGLSLELPEGLRALSPLVRAPSEGRAFVEVAAAAPGLHEVAFTLASGERGTKQVAVGGDAPRSFQPRRVSSRDWYRLDDPDHWPVLWPAEPAFASDSAFRAIALAYPQRDLGWLPGGELGILITIVVASMAIGAVAIKPLGVQI
ncbi:MAG TPA: hypothetical protein VMT18_07605 [Planctomycetota bacterium]|nr:hypothetical protein [Planctomycetota bacterium]